MYCRKCGTMLRYAQYYLGGHGYLGYIECPNRARGGDDDHDIFQEFTREFNVADRELRRFYENRERASRGAK